MGIGKKIDGDLEEMMDKEDRRVVRTQRLLKQALIDLTAEKLYEEITIRDITDKADIGYATFFRHYDGRDDLMLEIFTGIIDELESLPEKRDERYFEQEGYLLFEHVFENRSLYSSIFDSHTFTRKFRKHVKKMIQSHLDEHVEQIVSPAFAVDIAAQHMASSLLGLIDWWLANDTSYSIERMALVYERLIIQATWHAMNSDNSLMLPWTERG